MHFYQRTENDLTFTKPLYIPTVDTYIVYLMELIHFKVIDFCTHKAHAIFLRVFTSITLFFDNDVTFNYSLFTVGLIAPFLKIFIAHYIHDEWLDDQLYEMLCYIYMVNTKVVIICRILMHTLRMHIVMLLCASTKYAFKSTETEVCSWNVVKLVTHMNDAQKTFTLFILVRTSLNFFQVIVFICDNDCAA